MKTLKNILISLVSLILAIIVFGVILAYLPMQPKPRHKGITPGEASSMRQNFKEPYQEFVTSDGDTLFMRRWNPDSLDPAKKDVAVLIFHGFTAHSGAYKMAGDPISAAGFTTFGLDYRGHGLSDGNRGDIESKERWIADLSESVKYVKDLGFQKVIILGHSLGVASAICATNAVQDKVSGLILLSGAYEGKKSLTKPPTLFQKTKILSSSIFRPSYPVVEYYRDGMTGADDPLFNFKYSLRYLTMLDVKTLRLPETIDIPVLVGIGDQDELFEITKVKEFFDLVPGNKKEFLVMKNTTHAKIPSESWGEIISWLNRNF